MRRAAGLMQQVAELGNLHGALGRALAGRRHSEEGRRFVENREAQLGRLVEALASGTWRPGGYRRFVVRDPKVRVIHAAPFGDRVVHHAVMAVAGPWMEKGAQDRSFACRLGKGNRAAVRWAVRCSGARRWFLKLDVRKYFDSVDHAVLMGLLRRRFKDGRLLEWFARVVGSYETTPGKGLPIGTLTSQYLANFYLDGLDRRIVEVLGCRHHARFMDDLVLWADDPGTLQGWLEDLRAWLGRERGLEWKGTPRPLPTRDGVPFLGYRILPGRVLLGRRARRRLRTRLLELEALHRRGEIDTAMLRRRASSLFSFTDAADCRPWRGRMLEARGEGVDA